MITKNYYVARRTYDTNVNTSNPIPAAPYTVKSINGSEYSGIKGSITQGRVLWNSSNLAVHLGTGTAPETADDYCLDNDITATLTGVTFNVQNTVSLEQSRYCYESIITISFANHTGTAIDITEVGVSVSWIYNGDGNMLIFRKLINPVHVENAQSGTIVLNWFDF